MPQELHARVLREFWKLQLQVAAMAEELAAKADVVTAKTEQLYDTKHQLTLALEAAGVIHARSFLEYVLKQWAREAELTASEEQKKRWAVFKDGLKKREDLVRCLRREVPTWVQANMSDDEAVANMAANLESISLDASNEIHTFKRGSGLALHKTQQNGPTVAALACLAASMNVPCHIVKHTFIENGNNATLT